MVKVLKFKSQNLLGESRKEEDSRLGREKRKAILSGKTPAYVREYKRGGALYLSGTTKFQRAKRKKILTDANLKDLI